VIAEQKWPSDYCPECGSDKGHDEPQAGGGWHVQCGNCGQEYFTDIDYSDVVRANLRRMFDATPPAGAGEAAATVFVEGESGWIDPAKRDAESLVEVTMQLHARASMYGTKAMHDAWLLNRAELLRRLATPTPLPEAVREIADEIARWEEVGPIASDDTVSVPAATLHQWAAALRAIPAQAQRKENDDV
jgi:hypothetical protein